MKLEACPGCGARAIDRNGKCAYCGSHLHILADVSPLRAATTQSTCKIKSDALDSRKKELAKEIAFLENQYKETAHPSILKKIENAQNKLRNLKQTTSQKP